MGDTPEASKYVTLVSGDGLEFVVLRDAVAISPVLKSMLDPNSPFQEGKTGRCVLEGIRYVGFVFFHSPARLRHPIVS